VAVAVSRGRRRVAPDAPPRALFDAVARLGFGDWSWRADPAQLADPEWGDLFATLELLREDLVESRRELQELRRIGSVHAGLWSGTAPALRPFADLVQPLLELLGPALGAEQLGYWEVDRSRRRLTCRWEWIVAGRPPLRDLSLPLPQLGDGARFDVYAVRADHLAPSSPPGTAAFLRRLGIGAALVAPCGTGSRLTGLLAAAVRAPDRVWTERQRRLLADAAHALAARLEAQRSAAALRSANARLRAEVRARTVELAETNRRLRLDAARRRVAEAALQEREALYRGLIETSPDAVLLCTLGGRVRMANQAARRLYGDSGAGLVPRRVQELVGAAGPASRLLGPAGTGEGEGRCPTLAGGSFVGEYRARRIAVPGRRPDALLVIVRDVTERRRIEREAQQARQLEAVGTLAAGIAHDFNNLLTVVVNNIGLARLQGGDDPGLRRGLADAETAALRAAGLTRQLLTFARGGAPERRAVELRPLVIEAARLVAAGGPTRCRIDVPRDLPPVEADPAQLGQVLHNLLLNAQQAQPGRGAIVVRARPGATPAGRARPGSVRIAVRDRGPGIPAETLPRIFDPYFTTKPGGMGLGLTTAYQIVRRHGGTLRCSSTVGSGTTFTFELPAAAPGPAAGSRSRVRGRATEASGRVLLLDDERRLRTVVAHLLLQAGYDAVAVGDGDAAIRAWSEARAAGRPFDVLLLDLTIPGGRGGLETLAEIRRHDRRVPAVAVSGYCDDPVMSEFRAHGFQARLPKPFRAEELLRVLGEVLHGRFRAGEGAPGRRGGRRSPRRA
jgi:PAS domain S-box-containing protein